MTCGTDGTVRVWAATAWAEGEEGGPIAYKVSNTIKMDAPCKCVDVSSAGVLAVALEGTVENMPTRTGSIHLFSFPECKFISEVRDTEARIVHLTFSPDGNILAAATDFGAIVIYTLIPETGWLLKRTLNAADPCHKIDFSTDNLYLRCSYLGSKDFQIYDMGPEKFGEDVTAVVNEVPIHTIYTVDTIYSILHCILYILYTPYIGPDGLSSDSSEFDLGWRGQRVGFESKSAHCIFVQYPQYFSNASLKDVLDNTNASNYILAQTLRDCARCITSSGTNTVWNISNPTFQFNPTTRSEDLATSLDHIPASKSVYLCSYVALGVAKKTEDYLDALYRWAAGPLELLCLLIFRFKFMWRMALVAALLGLQVRQHYPLLSPSIPY